MLSCIALQISLFIYNVQKSVSANELNAFLAENGFNVVHLKCVSHDEARQKSFQLSVPKTELSRLFDADM